MTHPAAAARARPCIACQTSEISCWALARHRGGGRLCCTTCDHNPPEED